MEEINNNNNLKRNKLKYLIICIVIVLIALIGYFLSPISNIDKINITNNSFVSDEYILKIIDLSLDDKFLFVFPDIRENKAQKNELISQIDITLSSNRTVNINVKENSILGYQIDGDGNDSKMYLILSDGSLYPFKADEISSIALLPLFINISQENRKIIVDQLKNVDIDVLSRISEISMVSFTYDDNMVKCISDDGYIIYCPINYLNQINNYFEIIKNDNQSARCILFLDDLSSAFITDCSNLQKYQNDITDEE